MPTHITERGERGGTRSVACFDQVGQTLSERSIIDGRPILSQATPALGLCLAGEVARREELGLVVRGFSRSLTTAIAITALALTPAWPTPVLAAGFHAYSHAWENSSGLTGASVVRLDKAVSGLPNDGCSGPYGPHPVYQPLWVEWVSGSSWYELGTGHQCSGTYNYWYWGFALNGTWYSEGFQAGITNSISHTFKIDKAPSGPTTYAYYYRVDGVTKGHTNSDVTATTADQGLESYCSGCTVLSYSANNLSVLRSGTWQYWSGRDGSGVGVAQGMCGHWGGTDSIWILSENASC